MARQRRQRDELQTAGERLSSRSMCEKLRGNGCRKLRRRNFKLAIGPNPCRRSFSVFTFVLRGILRLCPLHPRDSSNFPSSVSLGFPTVAFPRNAARTYPGQGTMSHPDNRTPSLCMLATLLHRPWPGILRRDRHPVSRHAL